VDTDIANKIDSLSATIKRCKRVAVAFSGGVDSTFLLSVAHEILGDEVVAITVSAPHIPEWEVAEARECAQRFGVEHVVIEAGEEGLAEIRDNSPERCYICKKSIFTKIIDAALDRGCTCVIEASNADDRSEYRPGLRALRELNVMSPLVEAGLTKEEIRAASRERGLETWRKPALACLATRIPYGEELTPEKLERVGKGERYLRSLGFVAVRIRSHGGIARIEVPAADIARLLDQPTREKIARHLKQLGFLYITVDLEGYRTGSLNEELDK
jgi:uncharacterized protein